MVSAISGSNTYQYQNTVSSSKSLTDEQKKTIEDIISKYDSENATQDEIKAMFDELKAAGIQPSDEVKSILDEAGFAPPEKPADAPDNSSQVDKPQYLMDFIKKAESGKVSDEDVTTLIQNLQNSGQLLQGSLVDKTS